MTTLICCVMANIYFIAHDFKPLSNYRFWGWVWVALSAFDLILKIIKEEL